LRAVVLTAPEKLEVADRQPSEPQKNEVAVRVRAAGIGGTDLRIYKGVISAKLPLVLGQEFSGTVEKVDGDVKGFSAGDRVCVEPVVRDNTCEYCKSGIYTLCSGLKVFGIQLDGGFSESISVPKYTLHKLPDRTTFEEGALVVPAAVALYAFSRAGSIKNPSVAIIGGGPIGLCALQIAKFSRATKVLVSEPLDSRRALASKLGATKVSKPDQQDFTAAVNELTSGNGFDLVVEATGIPESVDAALASARRGGTVVFAGAFGKPAQLNMANIVRKNLDVKGSWLYPNKYGEALKLISDSRIAVKDLITHRFKLEEASKAFEVALSPDASKVIFAG